MSQFALVIFANWVGLIVLAIFLFETLEKHMAAIDNLNTETAGLATAVGNAVTAIQALAAKIGTNSNDSQVQTDADQIHSLATALQAAVDAANAPPAPAPAP